MLDFLRFLGSLVVVLWKYVYRSYIARLKPLYALLARKIIKNQRAFIIWPVSIAFVISYPSLYTLLGSSQSIGCDYISDLHTLGAAAPSLSGLGPGLELKQMWFLPSQTPKENYFDVTPKALDKGFLAEVLSIQEVLLRGIPHDDDTVLVHSPLQFWDNDGDRLLHDKNTIRTLNRPAASYRSISHSGLLAGPVKVNGVVKSAEAVRVMMMYVKGPNVVDYGSIWEANLAQVQNSTSIEFRVAMNEEMPQSQNYILRLMRMNWFDHFILGSCYTLMAVYIIISLMNFSTVTSKCGLLFAFVVEMVLSILSAATLTTYIFSSVDFFDVPLQFLPFVVVVVGIENMFRLMTKIAEAPGEMSVSTRLTRTLEDCGITSTLVVLTDLAILGLIYPYIVPSSKLFCIFASFALVTDHVLHLTYFVSVLSIDVHRMELKDLLDNTEQPKRKSWVKYFLGESGSLDGNFDDNNRLRKYLNKALGAVDKITLPLSTNVTGSIVALLFFAGSNIRWMGNTFLFTGGNSAFDSDILKPSDVENIFDKSILRREISDLLNSKVLKSSTQVLIAVDRPSIAMQGEIVTPLPSHFSLSTAYRFDVYYVLEFLTLLTFVLSLSLIALRYFAVNIDVDDDDKSSIKKTAEKEHSFQSKVLSGGHFLDVIKITTSMSHFIVSVGLDHKVLVWSPISQPMPLPSQLPVGSLLWPITHVVLGDHGNFIALFSKTGVIQCWSRLSMSWVWRLEVAGLKDTLPLESYFRHKTVPAFLQRKRANELLRATTPSRMSLSRRNSMRSISSPKLGVSEAFSNNSGVSNDSEECVIVTRTGEIFIISCTDGSLRKEVLSTTPLVSCAKILTPRMNDRLVSCDVSGTILVSTAVNNKWKTRSIFVDVNRFNNPDKAISSQQHAAGSAAMSRIPPKFRTQMTAEPSPRPQKHPINFDKSAIAIVPFVGFIVRTTEDVAELIDVQTGILIKRFNIRNFKKGSFRVFHDQPTHCRFCGSASIASLSVVYTLAEMKTVVMHTFTTDHRAKTSICLRVERDPREIRCVGFNQVTEHQHELSYVDGWCITDKNQIMGIKRKSDEHIQESIAKQSTLRRRRQPTQRHFTDESAPRLFNIWEGWTMNAYGKVETYDIPDVGNADGLLVNSVGQIARFGHKSIVVAFGNIMKVLYLGNDDLVYHDDDQPANEEISGLTFVNKRRRDLKKHEKPRPSMNFGEVDGIPGIPEMSL